MTALMTGFAGLASVAPSSVAAETATVAGTEAEARALAERTGRVIEVLDARTEYATLYANPSGTMTLTQSTAPVRALEGGTWTAVDTTLVRQADGTIGSVATPTGVALSAGGSDSPVVRVTRDGASLALTWPGTLPAPTLSGNAATYAEVLPGVDLVVTVHPDTVSEVLVVKNRSAAANTALHRVTYGVQTTGVTLRRDAGGGFAAVDAAGTPVFVSPQPTMWDSSGTAAGARRTVAPAEGDQVADMRLELGAGALSVVPDLALLTAPTTTFPVYLDPTISAGQSQRAMVDKTFPSNEYHNWAGDEGVGYQNFSGTSTKRLFFAFNTSSIVDKTIINATFSAFETWASSCTATDVELWETGAFSSATNWSNQPAWSKKIATRRVAAGRDGCNPGGLTIEFAARTAAVDAAANNWTTTSLGLRATNELDNLSWKRFQYNATFSIEYNTPPNQPSSTYLRTTSPTTTCATGAARPWIGDNTPSLTARLTDPDAGDTLVADFEYAYIATGSPRTLVRTTTWKASNNDHAQVIPKTGVLADGTYWWRVRGYDGVDGSPMSVSCEFTLDTVDPTALPVVVSTEYQENVNNQRQLGSMGSFTFSSVEVAADVKSYKWSVNSDSMGNTATPATLNGAVTVSWPADKVGPNFLKVQSVDRAGNLGPIRTYLYGIDVEWTKRAWYKLDEPSGNLISDSSGNALDASTYGSPARVPGRSHELGDLEDSALEFTPGPENDRVTRNAYVVDTSKGFTVSAWVKAYGTSGTAVSQDGVNKSAFKLGYNATTSSFEFTMFTADTTTATSVTASAPNSAGSGWVHVTGVYRPAGAPQQSATLNIYLDGTRDSVAWPNSSKPIASTFFNNTEQFRIASAINVTELWNGVIDEVRIYPAALDDGSVHQNALEDYDN